MFRPGRASTWAFLGSRHAAPKPRSGGLLLPAVLGFPRTQLFVEAFGHGRDFLDGGVVLLALHALHLRLLLGRHIGLRGDFASYSDLMQPR